MSDFIREKVCFYTSVFGMSSAMEIACYAAGCGAAGLELNAGYEEFRAPDILRAKEFKNRIKTLGLVIPCFSKGCDLVGEDAAENAENLKRYADICAELEIPYLHHTVAYGFRLTEPIDNIEEKRKIGAEFSRDVYEYAKRLGVKTIVEDQGYVFNGIDNYRKLRELSGADIGVLLDTGNSYFVGTDSCDFAEEFKHIVDHVHLKDVIVTEEPLTPMNIRLLNGGYYNECLFGEGSVNFDKIAKSLSDVSYSGYYSMEFSRSVYTSHESIRSALDFVERKFG